MDKPSGVDTLMMSIGAITIGIPFAALGIICCMSVVLIIPGIILIALSGVPLFLVQSRSITKATEYRMRDHPLYEDEEKPWLDEDGL